MPDLRGKEAEIWLYVDSDHAGDLLVRRSRTGFFVFLNSAPLICGFLEAATDRGDFAVGAEFVAMKNGIECARGLRHKLRMMSIPIDGPAFVDYGDNMSEIHKTQRPEFMLKKKSNYVCYHCCREPLAINNE
jgi:hypothetical protein